MSNRPARVVLAAALLSGACAENDAKYGIEDPRPDEVEDETEAGPSEGRPPTMGRCGDGRIDLGEACDDGVNNGAYGRCKPGCHEVAPHCGDGRVDPPYEGCDDGTNDGTYGSCARDCARAAPHCGDGHLDATEACDDGNDVDGDGCNHDCVVSGSVRWVHVADDTQGRCVAAAVTRSRSVAVFDAGGARALDRDGLPTWQADFSNVTVAAALREGYESVRLVGRREGEAWSVRMDGEGQAARPVVEARVRGGWVAIAGGPTSVLASAHALWPEHARPWSTHADLDRVTGVVSTPDGGAIAVGGVGPRAAAARYAGDGEPLWTTELDATTDATGIVLLPDGSSRVAVSERIIAVDAGGSPIWAAALPAAALAPLAEGDIVAAAPSGAVHRIAADGALRWTRSIPALDQASAIATDTEDRIIVCGASGRAPVVVSLAP